MYAQTGFINPIIFKDATGMPNDKKPATIEYLHAYISIPIKVGYEYSKKGFIYGNIGFTASFLLNAKITSPIFNENLDEMNRNKFRCN